VPVEGVAVEWQDRVVDLLDLAEALEDLADQSRRLRDVVMLHWFGGLKYADAARELGISPSTAEKDFRYALAWLGRRLSAGAADGH
jgi:DNA-directed RNA polymerase specialized sigma24 family protein